MLYKNNRGFTLIELLVVIAIIGILSSVVLASLNTAREKSRDTARISDVRQIQLALELFFDTCGDYPTLAVAGDAVAGLTDDDCPASETLGDFMSQVPNDPQNNAYQYESVNDSADYCLGIDFEDTNSVPQNSVGACETALGTDYAVAP